MLDVTRLRVIDAVARSGSVTAAAKELSYSQPSVSHHLARLEAETGAQLLQRVGRGIPLTPAGQLLAARAAEILGRLDAADAELSAHVGLNAGRVRLAGFSSAIGSLVRGARAALPRKHPGLQVHLTDTHPLEALELLRTGPVRSSSSASSGCVSVRCTCRPGCFRGSAARAPRTSDPIAEEKPASRTRPAFRPTWADSSASAASSRPRISAARAASSCPAGVSGMPRPTRCNSCAPVSASSRARW